MNDMKQFAGEYRAAMDRHLATHSRLADVRAALVNEPVRRRVPFRTMALVAAPSLAAAALLLWMFLPGSLSFTMGAKDVPGKEGAWLSAQRADLPLHFTDGTTVILRTGADGRIDAINEDGVRMSLNRGDARFHVIHRDNIAWFVNAGPYRVRVVGTQFELAWTPENRMFSLRLHEGEVTVDGPGMRQQRVTPGFVLQGQADSGRVVLTPAAAVTAIPSPAPLAPAVAIDPDTAATTPPGQTVARGKIQAVSRPSEWQQLAREARYEDALTAARRAGWDRLLSRLDERDLFALGETARLAGAVNDALVVYRQVRARFEGTATAADAAFMIGRLKQAGGDVAGSLSWYEICLRESPAGRSAPDAAGRRMEALHKTGDLDDAARAAADYLQKWPKGSYAALAQQLVQTNR